MLMREPAEYVPPPVPPLIVSAEFAPSPVTTTNERSVTVARRCNVTSHETSSSPAVPGRSVMELVPCPLAMAAPVPVLVSDQRKVRSPL